MANNLAQSQSSLLLLVYTLDILLGVSLLLIAKYYNFTGTVQTTIQTDNKLLVKHIKAFQV